jgi:hypothetical protein
MEWLIGGGVVVLLFAAAWWHSGRAKPERAQNWDRQAELDKMTFQNQRGAQTRGGGNI